MTETIYKKKKTEYNKKEENIMKNIFLQPRSFFLLLCILFLWGCKDDTQPETTPVVVESDTLSQYETPVLDIARPTLYTQLQEESGIESFLSMIQKAKLERWLNSADAMTIFVPTDKAITPLLQDRNFMNRVISDPSFLERFVKHHVIPVAIDPIVLQKNGMMYSASEAEISVLAQGSKSFLNGVIEIPKEHIKTGNGYIYFIEAPLLIE